LERAAGDPLRVILEAVRAEPQVTGPPGEILAAKQDVLLVGAGEGAVQILDLKPEGRSAMDAASFLRGYHPRPGDRFEVGTCSSASV
jgi:methionyl-tRNA formyltransferase